MTRRRKMTPEEKAASAKRAAEALARVEAVRAERERKIEEEEAAKAAAGAAPAPARDPLAIARKRLADVQKFRDNAESPEDAAMWDSECERLGERVRQLEAAQAPAPAPPPAATPPAHGSIDATGYAQALAPAEGALPFQGGAGQAPAPAANQLPAHADTGATVAAGELKADDLFPEQTPEMTLEQYASLCVERALRPGQEGQVAARYRIMTEAALRQLDEQWRGRFAQQGELYQRFQQAYAQYQAWLQRQGHS